MNIYIKENVHCTWLAGYMYPAMCHLHWELKEIPLQWFLVEQLNTNTRKLLTHCEKRWLGCGWIGRAIGWAIFYMIAEVFVSIVYCVCKAYNFT